MEDEWFASTESTEGQGLKVADLADNEHPFVYENDAGSKARAVIRETGVRVLPVLNSQRRVSAMLSRTDILTLTSTRTAHTAIQIASSEWFACQLQDDVEPILKRMLKQGIWYVPVISDSAKAYAGILGLENILAAFLKVARRNSEMMKVEDAMTRDVLTCSPEDKLTAVWRLMLDKGISGVPVVKGKRVVGMITQKDLIDSGAARLGVEGEKGRFTSSPTVAKLMKSPAQTLREGAKLDEAIATMLERRIGRLPVVDDAGLLIGIVDREDLLRALLRRM